VSEPDAVPGGGQVNRHVSYIPDAGLRRYVASYSGYQQAGVEPAVHRGLPSPFMTVIITLDDPLVIARHPDPGQPGGSYDLLAGGLHSSPAVIVHDGRQSGIQLAVSPLGARAILGLPAGELASVDVEGTEVLGRLAVRLRERVLEAAGWQARFAVIDQVLRAQIGATADGTRGCRTSEYERLTAAWRMLRRSGGTMPIARLADEIGWSDRHLRQLFSAEFGLTPKVAARVIRFDRARWELQRRAVAGRPAALAELAVWAGYFDQAHMDREFRELAGCAPTTWLAEEFRNLQADVGEPVPA
jgi:AraC-like DNA-binding protein